MLQDVKIGWYLFLRSFQIQRKEGSASLTIDWLESIVIASVFYFLYIHKGVEFSESDFNYVYFIVSGILLWQITQDSLIMPLNDFRNMRGILNQVKISWFSVLILFFFRINYKAIYRYLIIIIVASYFHSITLLSVTLFIFFALFFSSIFSVISLFLLPFDVINRLVSRILQLLLRPLMFLSGVVFPISVQNETIMALFEYNPFYFYIDQCRNILTLNAQNILPLASMVFSLFLGGGLVLIFRKSFKFLVEIS